MRDSYKPTQDEIRLLVKGLRGIWKRYEEDMDDEEALASIERLLYRTGVMQEE